MAAEKTSFRHAVELLSEGKVGALAAKGTKANHARRLESPIAPTAEGRQLLADVANYYHDRLKESPDALAYLAKRGIDNAEAIEKFKIGFSDRTLGLRLPTNQIKSGADMRSRLEEVGVIKETGHELLRGCLTFPIFNDGGVSEIYGRRIDDRAKCKHFYLPGPREGVFNLEAFIASDEIILCESIIGAITFWVAGYRNVSCVYGVNGFTSDIRKALRSHGVKRILLALDMDEAGDTGTEKIGKELLDEGYEVFRIRFPRGMDANEYAKTAAKGSDHENNLHNWMGLVIRNADWLGKGTPTEITTPTPDFLKQEREFIANESSRAAPPARQQPEPQPSVEDVPAETVAEPAAEVPVSDGQSHRTTTEATSEATKEKTPPVASPVPAAPQESGGRSHQTTSAELTEAGILIEIGNRIYRIRGLEKNASYDSLKLNIMVRRNDQEKFFVDSFDLYAARSRASFVKEVATELGFDVEVIKRDLGRLLLKLEEMQEQQITAKEPKEKEVEITDADKAAALELLQDPKLIERILADFEACGVVGEETNKLVGYLAATSRKLSKPLAVVIQSSSAAGKSSLMDAVLRFIPVEQQIGYSAMTGQSLFYMGSMQLAHKILAIAEEEGVAQASYALKLLQSEGELNIASTGKDPGTGRMETQEYHVEGPVMIFLTTTAIDIDEELLNRCIVLSVDENRQQTRAIHDQQRKSQTLEGMIAGGRSSTLRRLHQNCQRLLRPLRVVNPFAEMLDFTDDSARRRRDHMKYLTLIQSIALLHQYQREVISTVIEGERCEYIDVIPEDIVLANRLADQVLGRSIDELPTQTRRLLIELQAWVAGECERMKLERREFRFTRRMIRESIGWSQTALKKHVDRLVDMEFVILHRSGSRHVEYELFYDGRGREGQPTMCGLIDVAKLSKLIESRAEPTSTTQGSSPLKPASSPLDHPRITPSSSESPNGKATNNGLSVH